MEEFSRNQISLKNLKHNFQEVSRVASKNKIIFMIKCNAYGHGMFEVFNFAWKKLNIKHFGCASLNEVKQIRKKFQVPNTIRFYVFSDTMLNSAPILNYYARNQIYPAIHNLNDLSKVLQHNHKKKFRVPLFLKFNTGMNRLGIHWEDVNEVLKLLSKFEIKSVDHVASHLANSALDLRKNKPSIAQFDRFKKIIDHFNVEKIKIRESSIANSGAIEQKMGLEYTHVRPGLIMYGPTSLVKRCRKVSKLYGKTKILMNLKLKVLSLRRVSRGEPVGYGGHVTPHEGYLVHVVGGYGDGIDTRFSNKKIEYGGSEALVMGRVSMDMHAILFPLKMINTLKVKSELEFWPEDGKALENLLDSCKMIPYEFFCGLGNRIKNTY